MNCKRCNAPFTSNKPRQIYCSRHCLKLDASDRYRAAHPGYNGYTKKEPVYFAFLCIECGSEFQAQKKNERYCSERCRKNYLSKKWARSNREKIAPSAKATAQRRRALKKQLRADFTQEQWQSAKEYFGGRCAYCGSDGDMHQDHFIPLTKGGEYTAGNIVPACVRCNSSKNNKHPLLWLVLRKGGLVAYAKIIAYFKFFAP